MEATERFGDFKLGQVIHTVKPVYGLVLLAEEEKALQAMLDRLKLEEAMKGNECGRI